MAQATRSRSTAAHGMGSVYRVGDRWRGALVTVDPATGRRYRRTVSGRTAEETRDRLEELRLLGSPEPSMALGIYLRSWLPTTRPHLAPNTFRGYANLVRKVSASSLGMIRLADLRAADVERYMAELVATGLTPTTAVGVRKLLRVALRQAMRDDLVTRNAAQEARPPKVEPYRARTLSAGEARTLLDAVAGHAFGELYVLALTTGMRQGELLGLRWEDVDLVAGLLTVRSSLSAGWDRRRVLGPTKSPRSRRTIHLARAAVAALEGRRTVQEGHRAAMGPDWQDVDGLIFTDAAGRSLSGWTATAELRRVMAGAKLPPIRFHDLRHTWATLALQAGVPLVAVSRALGHSSVAVTAGVYIGSTPELARSAAETMDRVLGGS